ncbi:MAG: helix-turn-helix domain-containing protein [Bacteroidota bacterium]
MKSSKGANGYTDLIETIIVSVSISTGVPIEKITMPDRRPQARKQEYVTCRQVAVGMIYDKIKKISYSTIGYHLGNRDHSTIFKLKEKADWYKEINDELFMNCYHRSKKVFSDYFSSEAVGERIKKIKRKGFFIVYNEFNQMSKSEKYFTQVNNENTIKLSYDRFNHILDEIKSSKLSYVLGNTNIISINPRFL